MESRVLEVQPRALFGSAASGRYRRSGLIPAVVVESGKPSVSILLNNREFVRLAERSHTSSVFQLKGQPLDGERVLVEEIQRDLLRGDVLHVDFKLLKSGLKVKAKVPIVLKGTPYGVKNQGGILAVALRNVEVRSDADKLPEILELDISAMRLNARKKTADLPLPEGVELSGSDETVVVSVVTSRKKAESVETEGTEEGVEGGEAAAAGGADAGEGKAAAAKD